jgi:nitrogenase molybdenum-iron protein beta chain
MIGNSYGKFVQRDTLHKGKQHEVPLIRIGFPIFDRHHLHRMTTMGYEGAMYILTTLVNALPQRRAVCLAQSLRAHGPSPGRRSR